MLVSQWVSATAERAGLSAAPACLAGCQRFDCTFWCRRKRPQRLQQQVGAAHTIGPSLLEIARTMDWSRVAQNASAEMPGHCVVPTNSRGDEMTRGETPRSHSRPHSQSDIFLLA